MKKIYEKPAVTTAAVNTEEITISQQLSSFTIHNEETATKSWTTISY